MQLAVLGGGGLLSGGGLMRVAILGASVAGSLLLNGRQKPVGKLNDVRVSSSSYARGIAKIWGTIRTTGNMFWATDFREEKFYMTQKGKTKTGAKGQKKAKKGKATPMYKYYGNFAMGMCEGPVDGVLRVWADNNLIYNKYNPEDEDVVGPGFSQEDTDDTSKNSQRAKGGKKGSNGEGGAFKFRFYNGNETQKPDPFMENQEGVGKVPAYRGLCYLMFEDMAMEDFGNRIPTITAELTKHARQRPLVLNFENLPPPASGWQRQFDSRQPGWCFDPKNERIFLPAKDGDGNLVIRVYSTATRKELRRLEFSKMSAGMPWHTLVRTPEGAMATLGWLGIPKEEFARMQVHGVTLEGYLICYLMRGNYGITVFLSGEGKGIAAFGAEGNWLNPGQMGILAQKKGFGAIAQDPKGVPMAISIVQERFSRFHAFQLTESSGGSLYTKIWDRYPPEYCDFFFLGAPATDRALLGFVYRQKQFAIYTFQLETTNAPLQYHNEHAETGLFPLIVWPPSANNELLPNNYVIHYASYVVGAQCVAVILGPPGGDPWVVKFDGITGDEVWRKKMPFFNPMNIGGWDNPLQYNNTNCLYFYAQSNFITIDFANETISYDSSVPGSQYPDNNYPRHYWSERRAMVQIGNRPENPDEECPAIVYMDRHVQTGVGLKEIVRDVATDVGISGGDIDTTKLEQKEELIGWMMEQPTEARQVIQELANTFMFDVVESDFKLKFIARGQASVATIPADLLGEMQSDFDVAGEKVVETFAHTLELPQRVSLTFYNAKKDYETGMQYANRPSKPVPVMATKEHLEITLPAALRPIIAKITARRILYAAWSERHTVEWKLARDYLYLDPADVVTLNLDDGRSLETRITDIKQGNNYELEMTGTANFADGYSNADDEVDPDGGVVTQPGGGNIYAMPMILNIPYLTDDHENPRNTASYYWAAVARESGFNYGVLMSRTVDSGWMNEGVTQLDALWGVLQGDGVVPPPANGWNIEDVETQIVLEPAFNWNDPDVVYTWESVTDEDWPSEKNMIVIGEEIILFKDVVENPDGTVTISRLIRGYRGSIDAAYRHTVQDRWCLILEGAVHVNTEELSYINQSQWFSIVSSNALMVGNTEPGVIKGSPERPLPVGDVRRVNETNGDVTILWSRATRVGGGLKSGTATVPLAEAGELYQIFLLDKKYDAKTWDPTDDSKYLWTSEEIFTPFRTIPAVVLTNHGKSNTMDLHFVIYQKSYSVEWGFPHGITLPYHKIPV